MIADPRNDENKIIVQLHSLFMRLHNKIHATKIDNNPVGSNGFAETKQKVQQIYRQIVLNDYLPKIVEDEVIQKVKEKLKDGSTFYQQMNRRVNQASETDKPLLAMPVEFAHAAFRLGHSQLLDSYALQRNKLRFALFNTLLKDDKLAEVDLRGNEAITENTEIDWSLFFGDRAQKGAPLDTKLSASVFRLPRPAVTEPPISLAERDILRGIDFNLPSGQEVAIALEHIYGPIEVVKANKLGIPNEILKIDPSLETTTPLWYYILREAETLNAEKEQLGDIGSYIVAETILGSMDASGFDINTNCSSAQNASASIENPSKICSMVDLLTFLEEL